jgi:hypothetical protein
LIIAAIIAARNGVIPGRGTMRLSLFLQRPVMQLQGPWPKIRLIRPRETPMQNVDRARIKSNVRTIRISDVHPDFPGCSADYLLGFFGDIRC